MTRSLSRGSPNIPPLSLTWGSFQILPPSNFITMSLRIAPYHLGWCLNFTSDLLGVGLDSLMRMAWEFLDWCMRFSIACGFGFANGMAHEWRMVYVMLISQRLPMEYGRNTGHVYGGRNKIKGCRSIRKRKQWLMIPNLLGDASSHTLHGHFIGECGRALECGRLM